MLINQPNFRIAMTAISLVMVAFLYGQLPRQSAAVSGCRARLAQLELIAAQAAKRDADLDAREKVLDAAEAELNSVKQ
jgi:hypothetical protein